MGFHVRFSEPGPVRLSTCRRSSDSVLSTVPDDYRTCRTIRYCPKNSRVDITIARPDDCTGVALGISVFGSIRRCAVFPTRTRACVFARDTVVAAKRGRLRWFIARRCPTASLRFPSKRVGFAYFGDSLCGAILPGSTGDEARDRWTGCRSNRLSDGMYLSPDSERLGGRT